MPGNKSLDLRPAQAQSMFAVSFLDIPKLRLSRAWLSTCGTTGKEWTFKQALVEFKSSVESLLKRYCDHSLSFLFVSMKEHSLLP